MSKAFRKHILGYIAVALVCAMAVTAVAVFHSPNRASAETVVLTSPFTEAVAKVRDSVVGVNNYQLVTYSGSQGGSYYDFPWDYFFGFGSGSYGGSYGGRGNGRGNGRDSQDSSKEVQIGSGSGVVVAKNYVLTNYHVVDGASSLKISVLKDGDDEPTLYDATVAASDASKDVAVLYVQDLPLEPVELGDSDQLVVGDWAICIGNPGNGAGSVMTGTVTAGIISALNREVASGTTQTDPYGRKTKAVNTMIQTDAAINNGNSGGGMFNTAGQLVGIPTLKYSGTRYSSGAAVESIGMCIPINDAKALIEEATGKAPAATEEKPAENGAPEPKGEEPEHNGRYGKPRMGITVATLETNGVLPNGAYITAVEAGSPAEKAGLLPGDTIVEVNGTIVADTDDMMAQLNDLKEGDTVTVTVWRPTTVDDAQNLKISTDGEYIENIEVALAMLDGVAQ